MDTIFLFFYSYIYIYIYIYILLDDYKLIKMQKSNLSYVLNPLKKVIDLN